MIAVCDFVLASNLAHFAFGEVKLGLIPATIAPYVIHRIGAGKAKQLMLLGNSFSAEEALALGLVDERIQPQNMDAAFDRLKDAIVQGGAHAQKGIKQLMGQLNAPDVNPDLKELTARVIAASRIRITSYNVCYTKLLRQVVGFKNRHHFLIDSNETGISVLNVNKIR